MSPRPLIAGNWKMHGLAPAVDEARRVAQSLAATPARARVAIFPPDTLIERMARALSESEVLVGGQNLHPGDCGAFTGDVSAAMLADAGARMVILGHSERRTAYGETDAMVADKVRAALDGGLEPIVCVGESQADRDAGRWLQVIGDQAAGSLPRQLAGRPFALAYEPLWAIGSGQTPSPAEIEAAHRALRQVMIEVLGDSGRDAPILYGGSVVPDNAASILNLAEVGGALVGGASLKADEFLAIVRAAG